MPPDAYDTPVTFSREEVREIREILGKDLPLQCPHCGSGLQVRGPVAGGGTQGPVWYARCDACHRGGFVSEVPGSRQPKEPE